ncbi:MAG: hypothetical protein M2R46_05125 [Verrucomicrobia subdivision 3 bacterium]|nr:hypothetical protein [Limisphaerales bacterium]
MLIQYVSDKHFQPSAGAIRSCACRGSHQLRVFAKEICDVDRWDD